MMKRTRLELKLKKATKKLQAYLKPHNIIVPNCKIEIDSKLNEKILATSRYHGLILVRDNQISESVILHELVHRTQETLESPAMFIYLYTALAEGMAEFISKAIYPSHKIKYGVEYNLFELLYKLDNRVIIRVMKLNKLMLKPKDVDSIFGNPHTLSYFRNLIQDRLTHIKKSIKIANELNMVDPTFINHGEEIKAWKLILDKRFDQQREKLNSLLGQIYRKVMDEPIEHLGCEKQIKLNEEKVKSLLKKIVYHMKKSYGKNLVFIIHHGSWATGEANSDSDIDSLVMLEKITKSELAKLRDILNKKEFEKFTVLLFSRLDMDNFIPFARHQFHYGAKLLYGKCPLPEPTREEMSIEIKKVADEVGFWSKYLFTHQKQAENIVRKMYWRFKEAIIALKVYVHWKTGEFPLTRKRLKKLLNDPKDKEIVEIIENWAKNKDRYEKNPDPLLIKGLNFSQRILKKINKKT